MPAFQNAPDKRDSHVVALDVWRGIAVSILLIGHFFPIPWIDCGRLGVELFFVLSGYLIGRLLFLKATPLAVFYRRRVSRIFPAAYVYLGVVVCAVRLSGARIGIIGCISAATFWINYYLSSRAVQTIGVPVHHFWSLCIEEHSYVALSLVAAATRRNRKTALWVILAGIALVFANTLRVGIQHQWIHDEVYWRTDCRASSVLLGAAVVIWRSRGPRGSRAGRWGNLLTAGAMALQLSIFPDFARYTLGTALFALGLGEIASAQSAGGLWNSRPLVFLGRMSFSVYLWQEPFWSLMERGRIGAAAGCGAALLTGYLSFRLIENPTREWLNSHWGVRQPVAPEPAVAT